MILELLECIHDMDMINALLFLRFQSLGQIANPVVNELLNPLHPFEPKCE